MEVVAERTGESEMLAIGIAFGNTQAVINLDSKLSDGTSGGGIGRIDGKPWYENETAYYNKVLRNGRPCTVVVTVLKNNVRALCDDKEIINWKGDPDRLSLRDYPERIACDFTLSMLADFGT
jgi:hypothetical protein